MCCEIMSCEMIQNILNNPICSTESPTVCCVLYFEILMQVGRDHHLQYTVMPQFYVFVDIT
jgi:hypothetical protein